MIINCNHLFLVKDTDKVVGIDPGFSTLLTLKAQHPTRKSCPMRTYRLNELRKLLTDKEYLNATSTIFSPIRYDDWRELIPNDIKEWWQALSLETRLVGYVIARDCYSQYETDILEESTNKLPNPDISPRVLFDDIDKLPIDSDFNVEDLEESDDE